MRLHLSREPLLLLVVGTLFSCLGIIASPAQAADDTITLDERAYAVEWLLDEEFEDAGWKNRWTVESQGPGVSVSDGSMRIRRDGMEKPQSGVTVWYDQDLPDDVIVIVDAVTAPGNHACNLNFFLHASETGGAPLCYTRSGAYPEYHQIPNYLFTFTGGFMSGWSRARRNPGFTLVETDEKVRAAPDEQYEITLVCHKGELSFYIGDTLIHRYRDPNPLPGGRFGLRTWFSDVDYDRIRIGHILTDKTHASE